MQTGKIMRPQQNRRMRNQNNNRKSPNPLSKNYESNGPDIKIRGTAQHIADKYMTLARDAQAASDHVMAENYLQHAEHYNRIYLLLRHKFQLRLIMKKKMSSKIKNQSRKTTKKKKIMFAQKKQNLEKRMLKKTNKITKIQAI